MGLNYDSPSRSIGLNRKGGTEYSDNMIGQQISYGMARNVQVSFNVDFLLQKRLFEIYIYNHHIERRLH